MEKLRGMEHMDDKIFMVVAAGVVLAFLFRVVKMTRTQFPEDGAKFNFAKGAVVASMMAMLLPWVVIMILYTSYALYVFMFFAAFALVLITTVQAGCGIAEDGVYLFNVFGKVITRYKWSDVKKAEFKEGKLLLKVPRVRGTMKFDVPFEMRQTVSNIVEK